MEKAITSLVVVLIVGALAIGALVYLSNNANTGSSADNAATATNEKKDKPKMGVEEKYGFTTEGLGP